MSAKIQMFPGEQVSWSEFRSPQFAERLRPDLQETAMAHGLVAVDGIVPETRDDVAGRRVAVDHHPRGKNAPSRLALQSSSQQLYLKLNSGLRELVTVDDEYSLAMVADHPDPDVSASFFVSDYLERFDGLDAPQSTRLNALLRIVDLMDITGGSFKTKHDREIFQAQAAIFRPYMQSAREGLLKRKDPAEYEDIVRRIAAGMWRYVEHGETEDYEIDMNYEALGGGPDWQMILETGDYGRYKAFEEYGGIICVRELGWNDKVGSYMWLYSGLRKAYHQSLDLPELYKQFNKREKRLIGKSFTKNNRWGGSSHAGGSPKLTGSAIQPDELVAITNDAIGTSSRRD